MANQGPRHFKHNLLKWLSLAGIAGTFYLAASGIFIKQLNDVSNSWLILAWVASFTWLFLLIYLRIFSSAQKFIFLIGTIVAFNLLAQSTGGTQSPLSFTVFLLMGIAAWEGGATYGFWVAILFSFLEALYFRKEDTPVGVSLYLRWAALLVSAEFLRRVVGTRHEKERLDHQLKSLKNEAIQLASDAEPSSFNIPKDQLLMEEKRLTARVGTVMELEEALNRQMAFFQKALQVQTVVGFIPTVVQDKKALRLRAFASESDAIARDITIMPGETLIGLAAKEGRRILLNQMASESAKALPYYLKPRPVSSFLAMPIYLKNANLETSPPEEAELVAVLALDHSVQNYFSEQKLELVEQFGHLLAETIENARILHFSQTKTRNLHALYDVSHSFSALLTWPQVLDTALKTAKEIAPCDSAYIALVEGDDKRFTVKAWWGPSSSRANEKPEALEDELTEWVRANKKPIRYTRGQKDREFTLFAKREGMLGQVQSFLMVPLMMGGDLLGVIRLNSYKPDIYQEYDQDVLTTLANQTAMAFENALMVQQTKEMAIRDGLTGVYNHRHFQEKLAEELVKSERYNKDLSVVLLDVDHFKKFNDNYGHQEGDKVLKTVAEIIQNTVRHKIDTVARYGGEEFAVILPEADGNIGKDLAERIRKNIEGHIFENNGKTVYRVTTSIGVSSYPFDSREQKELIQFADKALYAAKGAGRNCVKRFTGSN
ncbi:MAG TPA: sensor domain-containing diguanylate cyclase [bacterium]|nr:sensor domain-containing diguanylate cyclase [bacterium]